MFVNRLLFRIKALLDKPMVRGTMWLLIAKAVRIFIQAAYFIVIARALGADQFGAFSGVLAMVGILAPFSSWGAENVMVKHVSRNLSLFNTYWGNTIVMTFLSGALLLILAEVIGSVILPDSISPLIIFLIALSDIICLRLIDACAKAFLCVDKLNQNARINIILSSKNLIAAFLLITFFPQPTVLQWAFLYCISTAISAVQCVWTVNRVVGKPKPDPSLIPSEMKEGMYFSIGLSSQSIYNDIDKTMLASLSTLNATGIYAAAYRIITVAFVPVQSIVAAGYARFFKHGEKGIRGSYSFAKRLVPFAAAYSGTCAIALILFAPVIPYILGDEYRDAVGAIRWLAPLLVLKSLSYFGADTLTGAGFQGVRSGVQVGVAVLNTLGNLLLIPAFSWKGAAWATLLADGCLALLVWGLVYYYYRRQNQVYAANDES